MEAFGAYSITLDPKHRFIIPTSYDINPDENLYMIKSGGKFIIKDRKGVDNDEKRITSPENLKCYKEALNTVKARTTRRVVMPHRYYENGSVPNKMVMLGQDTHILLLTPSQFDEKVSECDAKKVVTSGPKKGIILRPNDFVGSSFENQAWFESEIKRVDGSKRITNFKQYGFRPNEKLYCIFNKVGLELYHEWTFLEYLESLSDEQYGQIINFVFTISTDCSARLGIPATLDQFLINQGSAELVKTDFGAVIALNNYIHKGLFIPEASEENKVLKHVS